jgi:hypothetical protein
MASNRRPTSSTAWWSARCVLPRATSCQRSSGSMPARGSAAGTAGRRAPWAVSSGAGMVSRMRCRSGLKVVVADRPPTREPEGRISVRWAAGSTPWPSSREVEAA